MRISDWSSDVCSSDLFAGRQRFDRRACPPFPAGNERSGCSPGGERVAMREIAIVVGERDKMDLRARREVLEQVKAADLVTAIGRIRHAVRSEEHTSELQSLMRISYAVFCLKKKNYNTRVTISNTTITGILTTR